MSKNRYPIPARTHRVEQEIQRSRFITTVAHAPTIEAARAFIDSIREEFPDATHNCWAFAAGPPGDTAAIGMSDDGEPHGTAGRPMLTALLHGGVGEIAAVVTRYFGGTKLGTGGLVRAYTSSVQQALESLPTRERVDRTTLEVEIDYAHVDALRRILPDHEAEIEGEEYGAAVRYRIVLPEEGAQAFRRAVMDLSHGQAGVEGPDDEA